MSKKAEASMVELFGEVVELLPNSLFRVRLDNGHITLGHLSGRMKANTVRVLFGDKVQIKMTPYDLSKCRLESRQS
jgi:translation initiation factor IF-1